MVKGFVNVNSKHAREEIYPALLKESIKISTTKSCCKFYYYMWRAKNLQINYFYKKKQTKRPNKYTASFKTICSQEITENFGNSSILAIQLIKKGTFS